MINVPSKSRRRRRRRRREEEEGGGGGREEGVGREGVVCVCVVGGGGYFPTQDSSARNLPVPDQDVSQLNTNSATYVSALIGVRGSLLLTTIMIA